MQKQKREQITHSLSTVELHHILSTDESYTTSFQQMTGYMEDTYYNELNNLNTMDSLCHIETEEIICHMIPVELVIKFVADAYPDSMYKLLHYIEAFTMHYQIHDKIEAALHRAMKLTQHPELLKHFEYCYGKLPKQPAEGEITFDDDDAPAPVHQPIKGADLYYALGTSTIELHHILGKDPDYNLTFEEFQTTMETTMEDIFLSDLVKTVYDVNDGSIISCGIPLFWITNWAAKYYPSSVTPLIDYVEACAEEGLAYQLFTDVLLHIRNYPHNSQIMKAALLNRV